MPGSPICPQLSTRLCHRLCPYTLDYELYYGEHARACSLVCNHRAPEAHGLSLHAVRLRVSLRRAPLPPSLLVHRSSRISPLAPLSSAYSDSHAARLAASRGREGESNTYLHKGAEPTLATCLCLVLPSRRADHCDRRCWPPPSPRATRVSPLGSDPSCRLLPVQWAHSEGSGWRRDAAWRRTADASSFAVLFATRFLFPLSSLRPHPFQATAGSYIRVEDDTRCHTRRPGI